MIILLTGGAACGKSSYGEKICMSFSGPKYYIATMQPFGDDRLKKIERHQRIRAGKGFETIEKYTDLADVKIPKNGTVLLECICTLTANEMFDINGNMSDPRKKVLDGVATLAQQSENLIIITNDVGSDSKDYSESTMSYIHALHEINITLANESDHVYELVCGIPLVLKGNLII